MGRASVVTGKCTSEKCVRRAKTLYECEKCDHPMKACSYHRQRVLDQMKDHIFDNHPKAVEKVGQAYDKAIEQAPIEAARMEKIAASPTLQKIELGKRWAFIAAAVIVTLAGLGFLTWLKMHGR